MKYIFVFLLLVAITSAQSKGGSKGGSNGGVWSSKGGSSSSAWSQSESSVKVPTPSPVATQPTPSAVTPSPKPVVVTPPAPKPVLVTPSPTPKPTPSPRRVSKPSPKPTPVASASSSTHQTSGLVSTPVAQSNTHSSSSSHSSSGSAQSSSHSSSSSSRSASSSSSNSANSASSSSAHSASLANATHSQLVCPPCNCAATSVVKPSPSPHPSPSASATRVVAAVAKPIQGCENYGAYKLCGNVFVHGTQIQQQLGCASATTALRGNCTDNVNMTTTTDCCWCDEGGQRCLVRAVSTLSAVRVPAAALVSGDPHYIDWRGRAWDYQGKDDHLLAQVGNFRVEVKHTKCGSSVTCMTHVSFVDIQAKKTIQWANNNNWPFDCTGPLPLDAKNGTSVGKINATLLRYPNQWKVDLGGKLTVSLIVQGALRVESNLGKNFKDGDIQGGLVTGTIKGHVSELWGAQKIIKDSDLVRIPAGQAYDMGLTWRMSPNETTICESKLHPYDYAAPTEAPPCRMRDAVTNVTRLQFYPCCKSLLCSPEAYDECAFDHIQQKAYSTCMSGYDKQAEVVCNRARDDGACRGGWSDWSACKNKTQMRRYIISKLPLPGFDPCEKAHDVRQTRACIEV